MMFFTAPVPAWPDQDTSAAEENLHVELIDKCPGQMDVFRYNGTGELLQAKVVFSSSAVFLDYERLESLARSALELLYTKCGTARSIPRIAFALVCPGHDDADVAGVAIYRSGLDFELESGKSSDFQVLNLLYAASKRKEFWDRNAVAASPAVEDLIANPFTYKDKVVVVALKFLSMEEEHTARFSGPRGDILVTEVPSDKFMKGNVAVYLAGKVLGKTSLPGKDESLPRLSFVDSYLCKRSDCRDIAGL